MEPDVVAAAGLKALGKKPSVIAGRMNKVMGFVMGKVMPRQVALRIFGGMLSKAMDPNVL